ncbi:hypothetical protein CONPUDRAFT_149512 [Coniophora puteana RWD-64-598 SS2]|uniref:FAD-binding domain-containing protein n=1 Tax=Coniophora puteana (strain RWD-64-598) TaxID=741705 RepID=A0A5M3N173_CONPW|nr:uncharacterized protein CONPUDRAFT_149512 [Coniophora puteana RWD-64-598 SS2]EIW84631.1 hypothetical protein CONPUDRAFT_149512 [Coniophora puteana RWD-64-598 SS2]
MNTSTTILIAGAGPTGLIAALTLLKNGISVRIIEKERTTRRGQRGTGTYVSAFFLAILIGTEESRQPRTLEVYNFLGITEALDRAEEIQLFQSHTFGSVEVLKEFDFVPDAADPTPSIPFNRPLVLGQNIAEGIFMSHLAELGCIVEYGKELRGFTQNEKGVVAEISAWNGERDVSETIEAQFLIGADGATRKLLNLTFLGETREMTTVVTCDARFKCSALTRERTHHFGDGSNSSYDDHHLSQTLLNRVFSVVMMPVSWHGDDDGWQLIMSGDKIDADKLVTNKEALFSLIRDVIGCPVEFIELGWISYFRPNIRMADKFGHGRAFVAGDAAHIHSPTGGQGLNSGIQDGFQLAWKIALVAKGLSPLSLLETYTAERRPVIAQMLNLTTNLMDKTWGPKQVSVDSAWRRTRILYMLGVNYRTSPIVLDEFSSGVAPIPAYGFEISDQLVAGDRAPDAPGLFDGERAFKLFELFKPTHHTAMIFTSDVQAAEEIVSSLAAYSELGVVRILVVLPTGARLAGTVLGGARVFVDKDGYAHAHYYAQDSPRVVIVRPDGVVGAMVAGLSGVQKYFKLILSH